MTMNLLQGQFLPVSKREPSVQAGGYSPKYDSLSNFNEVQANGLGNETVQSAQLPDPWLLRVACARCCTDCSDHFQKQTASQNLKGLPHEHVTVSARL